VTSYLNFDLFAGSYLLRCALLWSGLAVAVPAAVLIALDFSKAFDNVRHSTLRNKMADLDIPDHVYNWLVSYFSGHSHCTRYGGGVVGPARISAG